MRTRAPGFALRGLLVSILVIGAPACGRKGPPLPPLVKLPAAPAELTADRRGSTVDLEFTIPPANTDNTRPANVSRVEVYAATSQPPAPGAPALTDELIVKRGVKVASTAVKSPRDPDQTIDEDETDADMEPPEGTGFDQGARAHFTEELTPQALVPVDLTKDRKKTPDVAASDGVAGPLLPPPPTVLTRIYVGVALTTKGRKGPFSKRASIPLMPPPPAPKPPEITYDERAVTVRWEPVTLGNAIQELPEEDDLPSSPLAAGPTIAYTVYDAGSSTKLTTKPITTTEFSDPRVVWGERRCYTVRTAETFGGMTIESEAPEAACEVLRDTFPPAAPSNLQSSPVEGAISLIWDPNTESDLAGYLIFRGVGAGGELQPITPAPIPDATFQDAVERGVAYVYAVKAVDKAGNVSEFSNRVQEMAR